MSWSCRWGEKIGRFGLTKVGSPRAYARGTWELKPEIQLQFAGVDLFLKLNISFDNVFVDPDCGGEKTNRPKLIPPIYLFDPGKALTDLPTRVGFYLSNDGRD